MKHVLFNAVMIFIALFFVVIGFEILGIAFRLFVVAVIIAVIIHVKHKLNKKQ